MKIQTLGMDFTVCKVEAILPDYLNAPFCFIGKTDAEISLVCPTACAPHHTHARADGWRAFRISGELDFSLVGVLAEISACLAREGISLFAVSTYNTDYVLIKKEKEAQALRALRAAGYETDGDAGEDA